MNVESQLFSEQLQQLGKRVQPILARSHFHLRVDWTMRRLPRSTLVCDFHSLVGSLIFVFL